MSDSMSQKSPSEVGTERSSKPGRSSMLSVASVESHGTKGDPSPLIPRDELKASATRARTEMVQNVLEGLRVEAFELARDTGVDVLTQPDRLRKLVNSLRDVVFPRASEEARELFNTGQKSGALACQSTDSASSYVSRRRRWWKLLMILDKSIKLSEPMRVQLLLEFSGLTSQESLVIKACASDVKSFESVAVM